MRRPVDSQTNVCTTVGAQEALYTIMSSFCNAGDEVVALTPAYDAYFKDALLLDVTIRSIALKYDASRLPETNGKLDANHYVVDLDVRVGGGGARAVPGCVARKVMVPLQPADVTDGHQCRPPSRWY